VAVSIPLMVEDEEDGTLSRCVASEY